MKKKGLLMLLLLSFCLVGLGLTNVRAAEIEIAPVRDGDTYLGRAYNKDFDKMFDDFNRSTLSDVSGTGLWWAYNTTDVETDAYLTERDGYLHVNYASAQGTTRDNPLYKAGVNANEFGTYDYLVFVMRGTSGASINELVLSFRYNDTYNDLDVPFENLLDPDMEPVVEFNGEYQVYIINLKDSLDGLFYTKTGEADVPAGSQMLGFHFMSEVDQTGTLDIREVYFSKDLNTLGYEESAQNFLIDGFDREDVHEAAGTNWWNGSCGNIVGKHLAIDYRTDYAQYRAGGYDCSNAAGQYDNFVLRVRGEVGGEDLRISPFYVTEGTEVWGEPVLLSTLKGPDDQTVPAIGTEFTNIVVNFEKAGWANNVNGFKLESPTAGNSLVYVDEIFFTNMEYNAAEVDTTYPVLDKNILVFDDFNRPTLGATSVYDGNNPVALENGFAFIISYAGIERLSVAGSDLVFDCTTDASYIQYTAVHTTHINDGSYPYVVFKLKTTDGGDANNFRIKTIEANDVASSDVWNNGGLKSGNGLEAANENQEGYEYVTADSYMYVIVDLAASNLGTKPEGFHLFYSGTGKLLIDTIFYAKDKQASYDESTRFVYEDANRGTLEDTVNHYWVQGGNVSVADNALVLDFSTGLHTYYQSASANNTMTLGQRYLVLTMRGAEGTDLGTFRLQTITGTDRSAEYFANQGTFKLADGSTLAVDALTTDYQTFIIDLVASGIDPHMEGLCITTGDWGNGTIYIDNISFVGEESKYLPEEAFVYEDANRETLEDTVNHYWVQGGNVSVADNALVLDFSTGLHTYYQSASANNTMTLGQRYLVLTMKGAEGTDLGTFRLQTITGTDRSAEYFANQGTFKLADGSTLAVDDLTTEYQTFIIDLVASGIDPHMEGLCITTGDWGNGTIYIDNISFLGANTALKQIEKRLVELTPVQLGTPANLEIVKEAGKLIVHFDVVENATGYTLFVYENGTEVYSQEVADGDELTFAEVGNYTAKLQASANFGYFVDSELSAAASFDVSAELPAPAGLKVELVEGKYVITFNAVDNATGYKIYLYQNDSVIYTQEVTNNAELAFDDEGTFVARLEALGNGGLYLNSNLSEGFSFTIEAAQQTGCATTGCNSTSVIFMLCSLAVAVFVFRKRH